MENNESQQLTKKEIRQERREDRWQKAESAARRRIFVRLGVWVLVLAAAGGLVFAAVNRKPAGSSSSDLIVPVSASDWTRGGADARVTLVEYSDFQCPACGYYYPLLKKLKDDYGEKLRFVYRYYPLQQLHPNANISAQAAQAAGLQGKFWEMHDILFENQKDWSLLPDAHKIFSGYAQSLGLDVVRFNKDIDSEAVKTAVRDGYKSGEDSGVQGTPTLFLNGKQITNPNGYDELKSIIDRAIAGP